MTPSSLARTRFVLQSGDTKVDKNYTAQRMIVEVLKGNKQIMLLYPEKRQFQGTEQAAGTMVAIYSTLREDLYVVYAGMDPESNVPVIHAFLNPLVKWIWLGGVWVVMGTLLALMPNRRATLVLSAATQPAAAIPGTAALTPTSPCEKAMTNAKRTASGHGFSRPSGEPRILAAFGP